MQWQIVALSDVADITSSKRIYASDYTDTGIPFYRSKEIIELHFILKMEILHGLGICME